MFGEFLAAMVGWIWGFVRLFEPVSDLSKALLGLHFCRRNRRSTVRHSVGRFCAFFVWVEAADGYGSVVRFMLAKESVWLVFAIICVVLGVNKDF